MWNSLVGADFAREASSSTSSIVRVYAPSSFGRRAKEQKTHTFRSTQTLVGLMCWLAAKKTRSPLRPRLARSASAPRPTRSWLS
jgi:hypothetical protein